MVFELRCFLEEAPIGLDIARMTGSAIFGTPQHSILCATKNGLSVQVFTHRSTT
jgi:hypothetical protein